MSTQGLGNVREFFNNLVSPEAQRRDELAFQRSVDELRRPVVQTAPSSDKVNAVAEAALNAVGDFKE